MFSTNQKILYITNYKGLSIFVNGLKENLKRVKDLDISIFDYGDDRIISDDNKEKPMFSFFWRKIISFRNTRFLRLFSFNLRLLLYRGVLKRELAGCDVVHILFLSPFLYKYSSLFKKNGKKIVVSFMGSDFYLSNEKQRKRLERILNLAQYITFNNPETKDQFLITFGIHYSDKTIITGFGLPLLENIKELRSSVTKESLKEKHGFKSDDIIITCGYNGSSRQLHNIILDNLVTIKGKLPLNIALLFPVTYGINKPGYYFELEDRLNHSGFKYKIIGNPEFPPFSFSNDKVAEIRLISDIVINIQLSDQASASLLEHLYAGSVLIVGDWLPYQFWNDTKQFYLRTSISELQNKLLNTIAELNSCRERVSLNSEKIYTEYNWNMVTGRWLKVIS